MPISPSAKKSLRKSVRLAKANSHFKEEAKKITKSYNAAPTLEGLKKVYSILDKAVKKHLFHQHKIARLKSHYSAKLANKPVKAVAKKKTATKKMS